jgi:probable HAF family extracellular repeat protein
MVDLGTLGGSYSYASTMNEGGRIVGASSTPGDEEEHAFSWTAASGMVDLGTFGGSFSYASDVNDAGRVVGSAWMAGDEVEHAFSWTQGTGIVDLGTLGGSYSFATAVNNAGQVVGTSATAGDLEEHAFVWTQAGGMVDLGELGGGYSSAVAVNVVGQVAGSSFLADDTQAAVFWQPVNPPSAPQTVSALPGDGLATVSFTAPASTGGAPVTYFTATASPGGRQSSGIGSPITIYGLTNGASYTFTVTATNLAGAGAPSAPSNAVVPLGSERPHADPPAATPRPDVPALTAPGGPRPPPPGH